MMVETSDIAQWRLKRPGVHCQIRI